LIRKILNNPNLSIQKRLRRFFFFLIDYYKTNTSWKKRFKAIFQQNREYQLSGDKSVEDKHIAFWQGFRRRVNLNTFRVCKNISGVENEHIIPEDIFTVDIEPTLNPHSALKFYEIKNLYNKWFGMNYFPKDFLHNINGEYFDKHLKSLTKHDLEVIIADLPYPVVMKPSIYSYGGKDVFFIKNKDDLLGKLNGRNNVVVQERIDQHQIFSQFNAKGINTIRAYVYKSVTNNSVHFLNAALRMGVGGSLDNETDGGIVSFINKSGYLHGFALDKYGRKFDKHPDSNLSFDEKIPDFEQMKILAVQIAKQVYFGRLVSMDLCYDDQANWRVIEVGTFGHTIRFAQYAGQPFFGEFTEEVIDYCLKNHWALK